MLSFSRLPLRNTNKYWRLFCTNQDSKSKIVNYGNMLRTYSNVNLSNAAEKATDKLKQAKNISEEYVKVNREKILSVKSSLQNITENVNSKVKFVKRMYIGLIILMGAFVIIYGADKITDIIIKCKKIGEDTNQ